VARSFRGRGKRSTPVYKWCTNRTVLVVPRTTVQIIADSIDICPFLGDIENPGTVIVERILLDISVLRLTTAVVQDCGFILRMQEVDPVTGLPTVVVNPSGDLSRIGSNKEVLLMGSVPVPPNMPVGNAAGQQPTQGILKSDWEFKGRRRLNRLNNALILWFATSTNDAVVQVTTRARVLLRLSS